MYNPFKLMYPAFKIFKLVSNESLESLKKRSILINRCSVVNKNASSAIRSV